MGSTSDSRADGAAKWKVPPRRSSVAVTSPLGLPPSTLYPVSAVSSDASPTTAQADGPSSNSQMTCGSSAGARASNSPSPAVVVVSSASGAYVAVGAGECGDQHDQQPADDGWHVFLLEEALRLRWRVPGHTGWCAPAVPDRRLPDPLGPARRGVRRRGCQVVSPSSAGLERRRTSGSARRSARLLSSHGARDRLAPCAVRGFGDPRWSSGSVRCW